MKDLTVELTNDEIWAIIHEQARRRFGISGRELLNQWKNGTWKDRDAARDIIAFARLLDRPNPLYS